MSESILSGRRKFINRKDAGIKLGKALSRYDNTDALVLGIPRGGVEVAYHVAEVIHGELSIIISKKLPYPDQEELAFGAIAEDNSVYFLPRASKLDKAWIQTMVRLQAKEIQYRIHEYRKGAPLPDMYNRIVIIVDDGIATGATIVPALKLCRARYASKIIVAAPVSGDNYVSDIRTLADDVVILEQPDDLFAVSQVYEDFHALSNRQVTVLLEDFEKNHMLRHGQS